MGLLIAFVAALIGYLFGSISAARIIGRFVAPQEDISRTELAVPGSDEKFTMTAASATSISLRVGPKYGCLTTIIDMLKVALPVLAFKWWFPESYYFLIVATMGVVGHNWPIYYRFKGGRGFSAVFGGLVVIDWIAIPITSLLGMVLGLIIFRDVLLAYMAGMWLLIPWLWFRTYDMAYLAYAVIVNILFLVAMLPDLKQYFKFKREGKVNLAAALQTTDMRHMIKLADKLGLNKKVEKKET
ncbi:MAG: glycerol-3-phosphate acyltransferase [Anaerolineae bacterium]|nr:glycerol-3-phosphate acyltransferase [Anaerolineae bacterium]